MSYFGTAPFRQRDRQNRVTYVAGAGQTTFALVYTPGYEDVYQNGVKLQRGIDYTATNGTSFVLTVAALINDVVEGVSIIASSPQDTYTKSQADAAAGIFYAIAAGTVDALSVTTTPLVPPLYNGMEVRVRVSGPNVSTSPTITFSNLGVAKTITTQGNQVIPAGSWATNQEITLRYNVTTDKMEWVTGLSPATAAEVLAGALNNKAVTPASLLAQFVGSNQAKTPTGYQKLPGGIIIQWGTCLANTSGIVTAFPLTYPTSALMMILAVFAGASYSYTASTGSVTTANYTAWASTSTTCSWISIGI